MLYDKHGILYKLYFNFSFDLIHLKISYPDDDVIILEADFFLRVKHDISLREPAKVKFILAEDEARVYVTTENVVVQEDIFRGNEKEYFKIEDEGKTLSAHADLSTLKESSPSYLYERYDYMRHIFSRKLKKVR